MGVVFGSLMVIVEIKLSGCGCTCYGDGVSGVYLLFAVRIGSRCSIVVTTRVGVVITPIGR